MIGSAIRGLNISESADDEPGLWINLGQLENQPFRQVLGNAIDVGRKTALVGADKNEPLHSVPGCQIGQLKSAIDVGIHGVKTMAFGEVDVFLSGGVNDHVRLAYRVADTW